MREHPILFSGPMVKALLAGRKSVTRRMSRQWLKVKAGDRLWVRETWGIEDGYVLYRADLADWSHLPALRWSPSIHMHRTSSRILLEAIEDARLERLQDITEEDALREGVEPWEVTGADLANAAISDDPPHLKELARLMGPGSFTAKCEFMMLWSTLHTKPGERWEDNPEVVRVGEFKRVEGSA